MSRAVREPTTTRHLQALRRLVAGEIPAPPVATLVGFTATHIEVMELDADGRHANPMGTLHGGILCDLSDAAMGTAMATTLEDDESFTTLDLTANYFKPVWKAHLRATAQVVRRTRTLGFVECEVLDESGSMVAKVFSTCMVLRGQEASGR
jgi:uncharacterized protein (TIGR00369 family)